MMAPFPIVVAVAAVIGLLAYMALYDLKHAKIQNKAVLVLLALWAVLMALEGFEHLLGSLGAGALLLVFGVVAWQFRVMGAGDAKLLLAAGLLLGFQTLLPFSMFMAIGAVVFVLALAAARRMVYTLPPAAAVRLDTIVSTRKIPAAVPIAVALAICLPVRYGLALG
jgi:prepilin peptidase CpaA